MKTNTRRKIFLLMAMLLLSGCQHTPFNGWVSDHTQDYRTQAESMPPLKTPPNMGTLKKDDYYNVQSVPHQDDQTVLPLLPPGNHFSERHKHHRTEH